MRMMEMEIEGRYCGVGGVDIKRLGGSILRDRGAL